MNARRPRKYVVPLPCKGKPIEARTQIGAAAELARHVRRCAPCAEEAARVLGRPLNVAQGELFAGEVARG